MKWGSCFVCGFVTRRFFQISHTLLKLFIGCCRFDITRQFILTLLVSLLCYYVTILLYLRRSLFKESAAAVARENAINPLRLGFCHPP